MTILEIFRDKTSRYTNKNAISMGDHKLTYGQLDSRVNRLSNFILSRKYSRNTAIGILMDGSVDSIVAVFAIMKAGHAFLPMDPDFPTDRLRQMVSESEMPLLISQSSYITELNKLQWECSELKDVVCVDTDDFYNISEKDNAKMNPELWDYVGELADDEISGGGWASSYTGEFLSKKEMSEYADNAFLKLQPFLSKEKKVLEIGCSSGISMFRIAPHVKSYYGIDISGKILAKTQQNVDERGLNNITLQRLAAHEIDRLSDHRFDIIIINSVIQSFKGYNYLRDVINKCIDLSEDEALIFAGDLLDTEKREELIDSCLTFKDHNPRYASETKTDWSSDLFVSKEFLDDLTIDQPALQSAEFSEKIGTCENELTRFRYDALLKISKADPKLSDTRPKKRYQYSRQEISRYSTESPVNSVEADDLAYIIYTSGSSGRPKGVKISHRSLFNYVTWLHKKYKITSSDSATLLSKISFDGSHPTVWATLLAGGELSIISDSGYPDPEKMIDTISDAANSIIKASPTLFRMLLEANNADLLYSLNSIRLIILGGEEININDIRRFFDKRDGVTIVNHYGPTECTVAVSVFDINKDNVDKFLKRPLIGRPIDNTNILILGPNNELLPPNVPGELYIGGASLSIGYLKNDLLTAQKFRTSLFPGDQNRWYSTGDKARYLFDGNIEYLGRLDDQVKIRGHRIELQEVNRQLSEYPGIAESYVLLKTGREGDKEIIGYYRSDYDIDIQDISSHLSNRLPEYMIPGRFIKMTKFPVLPNGKIDKKSFPSVEDSEEAGVKTEPVTELEIKLAQLWKDLLGQNLIGLEHNFFVLGGHSLKATQLVSRINKNFGISLRLKDIFENPTLGALSALIDGQGNSEVTKIPTISEQAYYETSFGQKRMWFLNLLENSAKAYAELSVFKIEGELDIRALEKAFHMLISGFEILRTNFSIRLEEPVQIIHTPEQSEFDIDLYEIPEEVDRDSFLQSLVYKMQNQPFDLEHDRLMRCKVIRHSPGRYYVLLSFHHIISDGWSMHKVMLPLLSEYYNKISNGSSVVANQPAIQYKDFASWQNKLVSSTDYSAQRLYWNEKFSDLPPVLDLPADYQRPEVRTGKGALSSLSLGIPLTGQIEELKLETGATLFQVFLTAVLVTLYRYTNQSDIVLGTAVSGRNHIDLEEQIGFFINTLPIRTKFSGESNFQAILNIVRSNVLEAVDHQLYPFDALVDDLRLPRDLGRNPLFDILILSDDFKDNDMESDKFGGLVIKELQSDYNVSKFDLTFNLRSENGELTLFVEYNTDLFKHWRISNMLLHIKGVLESAISEPNKPVKSLDFLSENEVKQLTEEFQTTAAHKVQPRHIISYFEKQVAITPNATAVVCKDIRWSYQELNERANQLANHLINCEGCIRGEVIAVSMQRSSYLIMSMLAIFKTGAVYVPLDPSQPESRTDYILSNAAPKLVLTDSEVAISIKSLCIHDILASSEAKENPEIQQNLSDKAYCIYTSGSTGKPKGAIVSHLGMINHINAKCELMAIGQGSRVAQLAPHSFDISVWQMLSALTKGGMTIVIGNQKLLDLDSFCREIADRGINVLQVVPSFLQTLLLYFEKEGVRYLPGCLTHVSVIGEALPVSIANQWLKLFPSVHLINAYGPTEASDAISHFHVRSPMNDSVPIGTPIPNCKIYILDQNNQLCPVGVPGEIVAGGFCVGMGYLNDPERTQQVFITNEIDPALGKSLYRTGDLGSWSENGVLKFHGRLDHQIKIRGFRIEPGEIESCLIDGGLVKNAVVIKVDDAADSILALYFTNDIKVKESEILDYLSGKLPTYMLPQMICQLSEIPLTSNGKTDRSRLPHPRDITRSTDNNKMKMRDEFDNRLAKIWCEILRLDHVASQDNFFALGGHSLKAVQLQLEIKNHFGITIQIQDVFGFPVLKDLSDFLKSKSHTGQEEVIPPAQDKAFYAVSESQKQFYLSSQTTDSTTAFQVFSSLHLHGSLDFKRLKNAVYELMRRHEILRTNFKFHEGQIVQFLNEVTEINIEIPVIDLSERIEQDQEIESEISIFRSKPFDLESDTPLFRLQILKLGQDKYVSLFLMHHILSDERSMYIFLEDLSFIYNNENHRKLEPLKFGYKDYVAWQNTHNLSGQQKNLDHWLMRLKGAPLFELPPDYPRPESRSYNGDAEKFMFSQYDSLRIQNFAVENQITAFTVLLSSLNLLLSKFSGQNDLTIGIPVSGRSMKALQRQVGPYLNAIAFRSVIQEDVSFKQLVNSVGQELLSDMSHSNYPLSQVIRALNPEVPSNRLPLFDIVTTYQESTGLKHISMNGLDISTYETPANSAQFDLAFDFSHDEKQITLVINYKNELYNSLTIKTLGEAMQNLIQWVFDNPETPVAECPVGIGSGVADQSEWQFDF